MVEHKVFVKTGDKLVYKDSIYYFRKKNKEDIKSSFIQDEKINQRQAPSAEELVVE